MKSIFSSLLLAMATTIHAAPGPAVSPDGRITFRFRAPEAREVAVQCEGGGPKQAMEKDTNGVWSCVTAPMEPDYYGYSFFVDGTRSINADNPLMKYNLLGTESMVHVPGPLSLPWELNDVPHGVLHHHFFKSKVSGEDRDFYVYTPPGYNSHRRYPVLYLLHGFSDDASGWVGVGRQNVICDNLIARGQARPMLVVMPLGYGTMEIVQGGWNKLSTSGMWETNMTLFRRTLMEEVLPQVEESYSVSKNRKDRAIAGLSMGGAESLYVGLNDVDQFAWIAAFSSGGLKDFAASYPNVDSKVNDRLRLLWISCGKDDGLFNPNQKLVQWLGSKDVHCSWNEVPGIHCWLVWRRNLTTVLPMLFR